MTYRAESPSKRKRWAALQAAWLKAQRDFRDLGWNEKPSAEARERDAGSLPPADRQAPPQPTTRGKHEQRKD